MELSHWTMNVWCDFFCVEEVHGMSDLIELKLVTEGEAECLHRLQVEAFMPLYEKYQDDDTSPVKESLKRVRLSHRMN